MRWLAFRWRDGRWQASSSPKMNSGDDYGAKRARNNESVRKCRDKKRFEQLEKEKRLIYLERGLLLARLCCGRAVTAACRLWADQGGERDAQEHHHLAGRGDPRTQAAAGARRARPSCMPRPQSAGQRRRPGLHAAANGPDADVPAAVHADAAAAAVLSVSRCLCVSETGAGQGRKNRRARNQFRHAPSHHRPPRSGGRTRHSICFARI